jgi:hypothetical protein
VNILKLTAFLYLAGMVLCNAASAQSLAGCGGIDQTAGAKVVLDKLEFKGETGNTQILTSEFECRFIIELNSRLKNLFPDTPPKPVLCANRAPSIDGSDFVPDLVKTLNSRDVLMELWGNIRASEENGEQMLGAYIFMMIIPVSHYEGSSAQLDFRLLSYPEEAKQGSLETAVVNMVLGTEFDVYASIANGIKKLKNGLYDSAKKYFSNARITWEIAMRNGSISSDSAAGQNRVLEYIKGLEEETIRAAADDPTYNGDLVAVVGVLAEERGP